MLAIVRSKLLLLLVVGGLLLQACSSAPATPPQAETQAQDAPATDQQNADPVTVKVAMMPFISLAPFYIAQEEGFFQEQGINVEFVDFVSQTEIIPAMLSGQVDVGSGLLSAGLFNAMAKDASIQIVADKGYIDPEGCPNIALVARRDLLELRDTITAEQLRGASLAHLRGSWLDYYAAKVLDTIGLTVDDLEVLTMPSPSIPEALDTGQVDLALNNEPWITRFTQAGHGPILTPVQELLPGSQSAITVYGPALLGENAEVGNRFMVAYLKAVHQYNEGKTERNVELLASMTQLDTSLLEEMCWPALRDDGSINVASVQDFQNWSVEQKLMDQVVSEDQFWNPAFAEYASEQVGVASK